MTSGEHGLAADDDGIPSPHPHDDAWAGRLIDAIVEGVVALDACARITFMSAGAERITGWSQAEVLGRSCDDIFHSLSPNSAFSALLPPPGSRCKVPVALRDGRRAILSVTQAHAPLPPRVSIQESEIALVFRDVSEEEAIHRLLGNFLANVSHEFRTPLSALAASVELLLDQLPDLSAAELEELLNSLHLGVWRLQSLVDNLLEAASLEAGHFRVFAHPCNVREIIAEAIFTTQPLLDQHRQRLVLDVPEALPPARADFRRAAQVLINLLSNASKYGRDGGRITVTVSVKSASAGEREVASEYVHIAVADQGAGLPPEAQRYLLDASPEMGAAPAERVGLGLSVVKAIVHAHHGEVGVEDTGTEGGAVVWFTLPVAVVTPLQRRGSS